MTKSIDWEKIRNGDKAVFDQLFDVYYYPLCSFVSNYINNNQLVEDIVVDCFAQIWEKRTTLHITSSLQNYLITIVKNATISYLRKHRLQFADVEHLADSIVEENETSLDEVGILNQLAQAVNKLPEQRRRILKMAAYEGKSYPQIAKELGISVNTVKTQMSRAYKFLKEELKVSNRTIFFLLSL